MSGFVLSRYLRFLDKYQGMMQRRFPGAVHVSRVFIFGFKDFLQEVKQYMMIKKKVLVEPDGMKSLSRKEMDIYFRMPNEMLKVGPVLLISALPFANYIVFPVAYMFPKYLLSSHFLSLQQKSKFACAHQKRKLLNYRHVFRNLQSNFQDIKNSRINASAQEILHKLGSGHRPTIREIMSIKTTFEFEPFSLKAMHGSQVKSLCRVHGLHTVWLKRLRLFEHAEMLHELDACILRDGIYDLVLDELKEACFLRGLNASDASSEEMTEYLHQWMSISVSIQPYSYSLLLHLPILLGYNHPNNWSLLRS